MKVPLQGVSLSQLSDGYTGKAVDVALATVAKDISDRGDDGKPRTVTLTLTFTPAGKDRVDVDTQVAFKVPPLHPPKTQAKFDHKAGGLIFNPDCSENPDQQTFADIDQEK